MNSPYLVALRFSALLSILGLALTIRHRASRYQTSLVLYLGLRVAVTGSTFSLFGLNLAHSLRRQLPLCRRLIAGQLGQLIKFTDYSQVKVRIRLRILVNLVSRFHCS